jgi:hypothetical protein
MAKKVYEKPKVRKVNLKADEAVLTACKGPGFSGPPIGNQNCKIGPNPCQTRTKT